MTTKLTATDHRKRQGAMTFRPQRMSADGKAVYHAANSRRFKCPCGVTHDWTHEGHYRGEVDCGCGLSHYRDNDLTPAAPST